MNWKNLAAGTSAAFVLLAFLFGNPVQHFTTTGLGYLTGKGNFPGTTFLALLVVAGQALLILTTDLPVLRSYWKGLFTSPKLYRITRLTASVMSILFYLNVYNISSDLHANSVLLSGVEYLSMLFIVCQVILVWIDKPKEEIA